MGPAPALRDSPMGVEAARPAVISAPIHRSSAHQCNRINHYNYYTHCIGCKSLLHLDRIGRRELVSDSAQLIKLLLRERL